jgi:hypothetical protein
MWFIVNECTAKCSPSSPPARILSPSSSVGEPGGKRVTVRILYVANVKGAVMTLKVHDGADANRVATLTSSSVSEPGGIQVLTLNDG